MVVTHGHTGTGLSAGCALEARYWSVNVHICAVCSYLDYFEILRDCVTGTVMYNASDVFLCSFHDVPVMLSARNRVWRLFP